jgi:aminodeoxychorismate lyase
MLVYLNGRFVPEEQAAVSVFDRGFLYGDGLFETLLVRAGRPFRWQAHVQRLEQGATCLRLRLPVAPGELRAAADELISRNRATDAVLRVHLSRGAGPRGYSPRGAAHPTLVMSLHPPPAHNPAAPPQWTLATASWRVPAGDPLAQFKTSDKLRHVLARAEAEDQGANEALLLNTAGEVVETASGNLFWIERGEVCTPPVAAGALPGVTRAVVLELCARLGLPAGERACNPETLPKAEGVFITLSTLGIVEATALDGRALAASPLTHRLRTACEQLVIVETSNESPHTT